MQESQFVDIITGIPREKWENALPIGAFREIQILNVMKRFFSCIARCQVRGEGGSKIVFVKVFRNLKNRPPEVLQQKVIKGYEASCFWYERFAHNENFSVVKPVFAIPEQLISVTEETRGDNLYELLLKDARFFPSRKKMAVLKTHLYRVGQWLKYKQSLFTIENEKYSIDELIDYLEVRLKILLEDPRRKFPAEYRRRILDYIERHRSALSENELLVTTNHSDFNPGNVLVAGEKVTVLDFGRLVSGSYLLDVSKLHFQIHLLTFKPQYRQSIAGELQQALLAGFANPHAGDMLMFKFLTVRHILTHLTGITHFWRYGFAERIYNLRVLRQELKLLDSILAER